MNTNLFGDIDTPIEIYKFYQKLKNSKDYISLIDEIEDLITYYNHRAECYVLKAKLYIKILNYEKAFENYTKAIQCNSKNASYYAIRGRQYFNCRDFYNAIEDFTFLINNPNLENYSYFTSDRSLRLISACAVGQWNLANEDINFIPDNYIFYTGAITGKITKKRLQEAIQGQVKIT